MKKGIFILIGVMTAAIFIMSMSACSLRKDVKRVETSSLGDSYPLKTNVTLKYWVILNSAAATTTNNLADTPYGKEVEKETGVKVEYIHPVQGQSAEQFNLLLASGELPDIIETTWGGFSGGPDKAIDDQYILKMNDYFSSFAPNFQKYIKDHPEIDKYIKTDSGNYFGFPFIRGDESLLVGMGPIIRKDWLDDLGLSVPQTIDEWEVMLKAFRDQKGAVVPLSFVTNLMERTGAFVGAYGITRDFYVDNGAVKYGCIEPEYKEFLKRFKKWFAEKLIDNNLGTLNNQTVDANIMNGHSGATVMNVGSGIGRYLSTMRASDPKYDLVGAPYPTLQKGEKPKFGHRDIPTVNIFAAITTKCKNVEVATRFLDYFYSDKGHMLSNFGIENVSYKMINGYPTYTEEITKNKDGLSMSAAMARYIRASDCGPFVQDKRYFEQYASLPRQQEAVRQWANTDAAEHKMPPVYFPTDDSKEIAKIMNDVKTYSDEMLYKFVMGTESLDHYDQYVAKLKDLGIDRAISIYQKALERYNNRK